MKKSLEPESSRRDFLKSSAMVAAAEYFKDLH